MPRIKMLTTSADPRGIRQAETEHDVSREEAETLIKAGSAVLVSNGVAAKPSAAAGSNGGPTKPDEGLDESDRDDADDEAKAKAEAAKAAAEAEAAKAKAEADAKAEAEKKAADEKAKAEAEAAKGGNRRK